MRFIFSLLLACTFVQITFSQTTLQGTVKNEQNEVIPYANIYIKGTQLGSESKEDGSFIIKNIPYSTYTIIASAVGYTKSIKEIVKKQAALAKASKLDGVVCSAKEIKYIKKICKKMEIVTPGIRFKNEKLNDQKRVMSPKEAFDNGATSIVMGRSIIKGNIKKNIQNLVKSLN